VTEENIALGSLVTFWGIETRLMLWADHIARMEKSVSVYQFLVEIPEMMRLIRGRSN
jgi:hypothetical protein